MQIHWTPKSIHNLEAIEHYISQDSPISAANIINKIIDAVEYIAEHPALGRPGRVIGTREWIISGTPYLIPYRIKGQKLEILCVLHGAMIWPEKF